MFFAFDKVAVRIQGTFVARPYIFVSRADEFWLNLPHYLSATPVHAQLEAVSQHRRLIRLHLFLPSDVDHVNEIVVTCKCNFAPINVTRVDRVKFSLPRRKMDFKFVLLPLKSLTVSKPTINADGLRESARCTCPGRGIRQDLPHFLQSPALRAMMAL